MEQPERWHGRRRGWPLGLALIQVFIALAVSGVRQVPVTAVQLGLLVAGPLALVLLRRWPVVASTVTGLVNVAYLLLGLPFPPIIPSTVVAIASPFARARREAYRRYQAEERRRRSEQEKRQAADERVRIARELHDVLAHSLSLINVRASVALEVMDVQPQEIRPALQAIKEASRDGLAEVRSVLASLRSDEAPRSPNPDLSRVDDLIEQAGAAGLKVEVETLGPRQTLPATVGLSAYRIIQEALTNVMRHSSARTATLVVQYADRAVTVGVADPGPASPKPDGHEGGRGLIGIQERAASVGGLATAQPDGRGGFEVMAVFPL
ncbi:MAG: sensor histidine kinase [Hamadaea sp.]|uniref:sensor histidine kinase n=1 Tax=Hamadaea sp. TaxID=2024425 RepID=UPI001837B49A|nr:histidine kinase [Hamadaea sp.]NUR71365.1 sensor histidine kinase [Hamadaea sp.]NUT23504.1 sensor histidine kinase [Hamadaea sp.]